MRAKQVAELHVTDEANLFRIKIEGRFSGEIVERVSRYWRAEMAAGSQRRFTLDMSQLTGYDNAGSRLLREMYKHGVYLSARSARSLVFLDEIATPAASGPTLVYTAPQDKAAKKPKPLTRAAASGE